MECQKSKILVVDDHALVREGLVHVLERDEQYVVCAQAENTEEALAALETEVANLVFVDLMLSGEDGLELVKTIRARWADLPVLVISARDEVLYAERALRAGASGYLMKGVRTSEILDAVQLALAGEIYLSRQQNSRLLGRLLKGDDPHAKDDVECLSDRELHIFQLIGGGLQPREIATDLGISVRTVETHRDNIKHKLQLDNSSAVTRFAVSWVESEGS